MDSFFTSRKHNLFFTLSLIAAFCWCCNPEDNFKNEKKTNFLQPLEVVISKECHKKIDVVIRDWDSKKISIEEYWQLNSKDIVTDCIWVKLLLNNPTPNTQVRHVYFPRANSTLEAYTWLDNKWQKDFLGITERKELLSVQVPANDSTIIYTFFPAVVQGEVHALWLQELDEKEKKDYETRGIIKFLIMGLMIFPICFFSVTTLIEKDRLNAAYVFFLIGATLNLITILDGTPYFAITPKIVNTIGLGMRFFLISIVLTLGGLMKYLHYLFEAKQYLKSLKKIGDYLIIGLALIALVPFLFTKLFLFENYDLYLPFFRVGSLILVLYIVFICVVAVKRNLPFNKLAIISFAPFLITTLIYAISFIVLGKYSETDIEALILIGGFILTIFLFGLILGVRNRKVKTANIVANERIKVLQELDNFKNRFYTNLTHEFRTPLTVILGMVDMIKGNENEKKSIKRNGNRVLDMVNQLLELSRLEDKKTEIQLIDDDILKYLGYLTDSCKSLATSKNIKLTFHSSLNTLVMGYDAHKLQRILINLLSNAIKFTPEEGSVQVMVEKTNFDENEWMKLSVTDTGVGIPDEEKEKIFDRFYQLDSSDTRQGEGSGIGLSLVKELVKLLEGKIELKSELGVGSNFIVYLPILQTGNKPSIREDVNIENVLDTSLEKQQNDEQNNQDKPLVLVIEDNTDVIAYIKACLKDEYAVQFAVNGKEGVKMAVEIVPDIIISDLMMPEMDGYQVCETLKNDERTSHIPFIMLTAKATDEDKIKGLEQGADAYLVKPFNRDELKARLRNMILWSKKLRESLTPYLKQNTDNRAIQNRESIFLLKLNKIIEKELHDQGFDTEGLCKHAGVSRTQLHRKLKAITGTSTATYIRSYRLQKAKELLEKSDRQVSQVAFEVGYKDLSHFSRSFAQEFGKSPSEFKPD